MMYVLQVITGNELAVLKELHRLGYTAYVPMEVRLERQGGRWRERQCILMSGYVFLDCDLTPQVYYAVKRIISVLRFLGSGQPEPLKQEERSYILWGTNDGRPLPPSDITLDAGGQIKTIAGPLVGHDASIIGINKHRRKVRVRFTLHGKEHELLLSANIRQTL